MEYEEKIYTYRHHVYRKNWVPNGDNAAALKRKFRMLVWRGRTLEMDSRFDSEEVRQLVGINNEYIATVALKAKNEYTRAEHRYSMKGDRQLFSSNHYGFNPGYFLTVQYGKRVRTFWGLFSDNGVWGVPFRMRISPFKMILFVLILVCIAAFITGPKLPDFHELTRRFPEVVYPIFAMLCGIFVAAVAGVKPAVENRIVAVFCPLSVDLLNLFTLIGLNASIVNRCDIPDAMFWKLRKAIHARDQTDLRGCPSYSMNISENGNRVAGLRLVTIDRPELMNCHKSLMSLIDVCIVIISLEEPKEDAFSVLSGCMEHGFKANARLIVIGVYTDRKSIHRNPRDQVKSLLPDNLRDFSEIRLVAVNQRVIASGNGVEAGLKLVANLICES